MEKDELKELFSNIITNKDCKKIIDKISKIQDSYILHILAYNLEYHGIYYTNSDYLCIEKAIINNLHCDFGTAMLLFYFRGGFTYLCDIGREYKGIIKFFNKITINKDTYFLEKLYIRILENNFNSKNILYTPKLGKIEFSILEKRNKFVPEIFLKTTPGTDKKTHKIWYKD